MANIRKVKYEASGASDLFLSYRAEDQREVYELAKKMAATDKFGFAFMRKLVWTDNGIDVSTVIVNADGSFENID